MASLFLTGRRNDGSLAWASINPAAHHVQAAVAERRFTAYCSPFRDEHSALAALGAAGCDPASIEPEQRKRRG